MPAHNALLNYTPTKRPQTLAQVIRMLESLQIKPSIVESEFTLVTKFFNLVLNDPFNLAGHT